MASIGRVNEGSVGYLTVTFKDEYNVPTAPVSATWEVHDLESGTELLAASSITPIASSVKLTLTPAINTFVDRKNDEETRRVTVKAVWGGLSGTNAEVDYDITDLTWVAG